MTLAAAAAARRRGVIRPRRRGRGAADRQRAQDARRADARAWATAVRAATRASPGLAPAIRPSLSAFERWLEGRRMSTVRIPPTLRVATGGAKHVEVAGRDGPRGRDRRSSPPIPGSSRSSSRRTATSTAFVNAFLNDTDVRHLAGPRHAGRRRRHARPAPGDGRRLERRSDDGRSRHVRPRRGPERGPRSGRRRPRCRPTGGRAPARPRAASPPPTGGSSRPAPRSATRRRRAIRPG